MTTPRLIEFYKDTLSFCGIKADDKGFCDINWQGTKVPCVIDQRRLCLPTYERLSAFDFQTNLIFHPLSEVPHRGESEILEKLRKCFTEKAENTIKIVMMGLLDIAANPHKQKDLDPDQAELLKAVVGADHDCLDYFREKVVLASIKSTTIMKFFSMNIRKSGKYKGKNVGTIGVIYFPFYEGLKAGKPEKAKEAYRKAFMDLYKFMLRVDDEEAYNRPAVNQLFAPLFCSFLLSAGGVAEELNRLMTLFSTHLFSSKEEAESYMFDMKVFDMMVDIEQLIPEVRALPMQTGNGGRVEPRAVKEESGIPKLPIANHEVTLQTTQVPQPVMQPVYQQPVYQQPMAQPQSSLMGAFGMPGMLGTVAPMQNQVATNVSPLAAALSHIPGGAVSVAGMAGMVGMHQQPQQVLQQDYVPAWLRQQTTPAVNSGIPHWL